jgi:hypothetical protein
VDIGISTAQLVQFAEYLVNRKRLALHGLTLNQVRNGVQVSTRGRLAENQPRDHRRQGYTSQEMNF